jgi:hypothetical protein
MVLSVLLACGAGGVEPADASGGFQFAAQPGVIGGEPPQVGQRGLELPG